MTAFFRVLFIQLVVWMGFYISLHWLTCNQIKNGLMPNNQWLMNIHIVFETLILYTAAYTIRKNKRLQISIIIAAFLFITVFIIQLITNGIEVYMNYADAVECITSTVLFAQVGFYYVKIKNSHGLITPELLTCLGLLLYFGGSVPYITMIHYLQKNNPELNHLLFDFISNVLANVRYVLLGFSFWLIYKKAHNLNVKL